MPWSSPRHQDPRLTLLIMLWMKDEGADGSGQPRFIFENVQSHPDLHGFYEKLKRRTGQAHTEPCPSHQYPPFSSVTVDLLTLDNGARKFHGTLYHRKYSAISGSSVESLIWLRNKGGVDKPLKPQAFTVATQGLCRLIRKKMRVHHYCTWTVLSGTPQCIRFKVPNSTVLYSNPDSD